MIVSERVQNSLYEINREKKERKRNQIVLVLRNCRCSR
jgi:hypothetical protein